MLEKGQSFGRYVVEAIVGKGGMGQVYRALDTVLHRHVALKLLLVENVDPAQWEEAKARMLREARAAASLQHPNAVAIYDLGTVGDTPYIAMELVPGGSLRGYVGDALVPWEKKLRWMVDVASALAAAHAAGLVHRDIKPENILVRPDGQVKVLDFGIARRSVVRGTADTVSSSAPSTQITGDGTVLGTPSYMPPEQIAGKALDGRADQFAWAVTTYELLAGVPPWPEQPDALATAAAILTEPPISLATVAADLPSEVTRAIDKALSKRPDDRFTSMEEVVEELDPFATPFVPPSAISNPALSMRPPPSRRVDPYGATQARPETGRAVASDRSAPTVRRPGRVGRVAPFAIGGVLLVAGLFFVVKRSNAPSPSSFSSASTVSSAPRALTLLDLPHPTSSNASALALYLAGIQAQHDANRESARAKLSDAVEADPSMGAAHLRYALSAFFPSPVTPRKHFLQATQARATLSAFDVALLDGVEPIFDRQPPDFAAADRKLTEATTRMPEDAELFAWLAWVRFQEGKTSEVAEAAAAALKLDPRYAAVHEILAQVAQLTNDTDGVLREVALCLEAAPQGTSCIQRRMGTLAASDRCVDYENDARQLIAINPDSAEGYGPLAESSFVLGKPIDAVWETLALSWSKLERDDAVWQQANDRFTLTSLLGDAVGQDAAVRAMQKAAVGRGEVYYHLVPAWGRVKLLTEAGDDAGAAAVADDYLRHRDAWTVDPGIDMWSIALDETPLMLKALVRGGKLGADELRARRAKWIDGWKERVGPIVARYLWIYGYAVNVDTAEDAAEALAALPAYEPLPPFRPSLLADADVGHVLLLGGRVDEALPILRRAAGSCNAFENQFEGVQASLWLGQALEKKGDTAGACVAYARVLARWEKLGKRSMTAAESKRRILALGCGK